MAARKRRRFWLWGSIGALVAVVALVVVVAAHSSGAKIDGSRIGTVTRTDIAKSVVATGKVQPITKVEVKSKASGIVEKWFVDANAHVHRGQVLAQLDRVEILAQVEAARATLLASQANVKTADADIHQDEVTANAPDLPMYAATLRRNQQMKAEGVVSQQALDDANRDYLSNMNKQRTAVATVAVDRAKLRQAEAQVAESEASLKQLEEQLNYTTVVSPIDGVVLSRDVEVGDAVSSILVLGSTATLIFTLGDTTQVYVDGKVDEADIGNVYMGQAARIRIESFKNKIFYGKVTRIAPLGVEKDNVTTFSVRVSIDNPNGEIKAMMTANAEILISEHKQVLAVPEQAISYDAQKHAFVNVPDAKVKEGMRKVAVTVGLANGSNTEITSGLKEGDKVVLQQ